MPTPDDKARENIDRLLTQADGRAAGVIEAKKEGVTLTSVETQSETQQKSIFDPQSLAEGGKLPSKSR
jgi:hypothetical protein